MKKTLASARCSGRLPPSASVRWQEWARTSASRTRAPGRPFLPPSADVPCTLPNPRLCRDDSLLRLRGLSQT